MTKITTKDIIHLAKLSNLTLDKNEIAIFKNQLDLIINHVNQLKEVDTKSVEPTSQTTGLENVTRKDIPFESLSDSLALSGIKTSHNYYFKVPIILEEKEI